MEGVHHQHRPSLEPPKCPILVRYMIICLIWLLSATGLVHRFRRAGGVFFIPGRLCLKISNKSSTEACTLTFVRQQTAIPVPKVHYVFVHQDRTYLVMQRLPGVNLAEGWVTRSTASRRQILLKLKELVIQLRSIARNSEQGVSSACGGPNYDPRLPRSSFWGPFASARDFHKSLRGGLDDASEPDLKRLVSFHNSTVDLVFTHGDLSSLNILCHGDEVTGIVDWETSGWLPYYWEYVCAWNVNPQNLFWREEVDSFLDASPQALEMDTVRRRYFGDF